MRAVGIALLFCVRLRARTRTMLLPLLPFSRPGLDFRPDCQEGDISTSNDAISPWYFCSLVNMGIVFPHEACCKVILFKPIGHVVLKQVHLW